MHNSAFLGHEYTYLGHFTRINAEIDEFESFGVGF